MANGNRCDCNGSLNAVVRPIVAIVTRLTCERTPTVEKYENHDLIEAKLFKHSTMSWSLLRIQDSLFTSE